MPLTFGSFFNRVDRSLFASIGRTESAVIVVLRAIGPGGVAGGDPIENRVGDIGRHLRQCVEQRRSNARFLLFPLHQGIDIQFCRFVLEARADTVGRPTLELAARMLKRPRPVAGVPSLSEISTP